MTTTCNENSVRKGFFLDRDNFLYTTALVDDSGKLRSEMSGLKLRDRTAVVAQSALMLDDDMYLIHDQGRKRSGLFFFSPYPVLEANMAGLRYDNFSCMWIKPSERMNGAYDAVADDDSDAATMLLLKINWCGEDALNHYTECIKSMNPIYVRIASSKAGNSGCIWVIIPKDEVVEELLVRKV